MKKIISFFKNNYYLASSVLMFLSFPSYDLLLFHGYTFFAWIALVPLFVFVRKKNLRDVLFYSFVAGWFGHLFTYHWIGNFAGVDYSGYFLIVFFLTPSLASFFAMKFFLAEYLSRKYEFLRVLIYPSVWLSFDFMQSIGYLAFPWMNWGYSQYQFTSFIQVSSIVGIFGVNFIIILFNYIVSDLVYFKILLKSKINLKSPVVVRFVAVSLTVVFLIVWGNYRIALIDAGKNNVKPFKISIVQSCISPWANWRYKRMFFLDTLLNLTKKTMPENPDLIVWSESATLETISDDYMRGNLNEFETKLFESIKELQVPLLTGEIGVTYKNDGRYMRRYPQNNVVLIDKDGKVKQTYAKINLVPFGEWFPYKKFPLVGKPFNQFLKMHGASEFVPGNVSEIFSVEGHHFGSLVCYEGMFARLCRNYKKMGASFLVNIVNDGWTHTFNGHTQHFSGSIFRAVENGIWYVRAGNTGYSAIIDPAGQIIKSIPILKEGSFTGNLYLKDDVPTFYSKYGDIFFYATQLFLFILFLIVLIRWILFLKNREKIST